LTQRHPGRSVVHPLSDIARYKLGLERDRILDHLRSSAHEQDLMFQRKVQINHRIGDALTRQLDSQARTQAVIAARAMLQMQAEQSGQNYDAMMAAKLAGPRATMQFVWRQMTMQSAAERIMIWKSNVKAAKDPAVRKLYMLGKVARTRRQRLVSESIQDGFHIMYENYIDWVFFNERRDSLYRGYDSEYDPDAEPENIFNRRKAKKPVILVDD